MTTNDKTYKTAAGFAVNDPRVFTSKAGKRYAMVTVKDFSGKTYGVRVFDNFLEQCEGSLQKGAVIFAEGPYEEVQRDGKTYHNISAYNLNVVPPLTAGSKEPVASGDSGTFGF